MAPEPTTDPVGKCSAIKDRLSHVNTTLDSITQGKSLDELLASLSNKEGAKMCTTLTFALATLLFVGLNAKGVDLSGHGVMRDIERIKMLVKLIKDAETDQDDTQDKKRPKLDSQAAHRFVKFHTSA